MKKLIALGMVAAFACAAYAYPTLNGATGYGVQPNAAVAPAGTFQIAADYCDTDEMVGDISYPIRANYSVGGNFELSGDYTLLEDLSSWNIGAKYAFCVGGIPMAIGGLYGDGDVEITTTQAYLAGDIVLAEGDDTTPSVVATLGANWTELEGSGDANAAIRGFVGLGVNMGAFSLVGDYQLDSDNLDYEGLYSVAARYQFTDMLGAQVGYSNAYISPYSAGTIGAPEAGLFAGLNLTFGPSAE